jgi:LPS-assembly protein
VLTTKATAVRTLRMAARVAALLAMVWAAPRGIGAQAQGPASTSSTSAPTASAESGTSKTKNGVAAQAGKAQPAAAVPSSTQAGEETATLEADHQSQVGRIYYADGNVDVHYQNTRLRADHAEYNEETQVVTARGNVRLDYDTQHVEADDARYEVKTGRGTFHHVRVTFLMQRRPSPTLLLSPNPLYFEAETADRLDQNTYKIRKAWLTVCDPNKPTWKFYAPEATVRLQQSVHLENGNFRLMSVPILYLPYASFPAGRERESGWMIPDAGDSSVKGLVFGDAFYWAPTDWMDATIGGAYFSKRGWSQTGELRMKPWQDALLTASYFGVVDRGVPQVTGPPINQGGHEVKLKFISPLPGGWRAVADLDQLTSLTFRLAWSETYTQAVNSEVRNAAFLTNNFDGFSLNFASLSYQNYLTVATTTTAENSITLRSAPEARFGSVDQAPFRGVLLYFSFDAFVSGVHRGEGVTPFETPAFVERNEFAPTVTMPLHWGPWLDVTPSFTFRSTHYGGQLQNGSFVNVGFFRNTEEFSLDLRPPSIERVWGGKSSKWKHVIEPQIVYDYVSGVNDFGRFVRFDEDETLTDTNEIEYGLTQRLYRKTADGDTEEFASWSLKQKYFFDPTFGGALAPGQRNVFQALDSLTPFAFADAARRFSPIVSDMKIEPGKRYDAEFIVDFDPQRAQMTAIGTLLKLKPYKESFLTLAHFSTLNFTPNTAPPPADLEGRSDQIRGLIGYGDLTRPGWNATLGASYDFSQGEFQNQIVQVGYNGSCCGLGFEYRKLSFGQVRNENQFRIVFLIANLGSVGNLRRQEKIF